MILRFLLSCCSRVILNLQLLISCFSFHRFISSMPGYTFLSSLILYISLSNILLFLNSFSSAFGSFWLVCCVRYLFYLSSCMSPFCFVLIHLFLSTPSSFFPTFASSSFMFVFTVQPKLNHTFSNAHFFFLTRRPAQRWFIFFDGNIWHQAHRQRRFRRWPGPSIGALPLMQSVVIPHTDAPHWLLDRITLVVA